MIAWLFLLSPLLAVFWLIGYAHKNPGARFPYWLYFVPIGATLAFILLAKTGAESWATRDVEYLSAAVQTATYTEPWNEKVACRHPIYRSEEYECGSSKEPRTCTRMVETGAYRHAFDVDEHGPSWSALDSQGDEHAISSGRFDELSAKFDNKTFVDLHRHYYTRNGNQYQTTWDGTPARCAEYVWAHSYENRVQASRSVFAYRPVSQSDKNRYALFDYPAINDDGQSIEILGGEVAGKAAAQQWLSYQNALLGPKRQVRIYVLIWKGGSVSNGIWQENLWQGGNKNEFVVCLGLDASERVSWAHTFSWTPQTDLKVEAKSKLLSERERPLDLLGYVKWLGERVDKSWKRKAFHDFAYLTVEPSGGTLLLIGIGSLLISVGTCAFVLLSGGGDSGNWRPPRRRSGAGSRPRPFAP